MSAHSHERYVVLSLWLALAFLTSSEIRSLPSGKRNALVLGSALPLAFNYVYKAVVLKIPLFVGTSGTRISPEPLAISRLTLEALFSLFGFNAGPHYLVGISISELGSTWAWLVATTFAVSSIAPIVIAVREAGLSALQTLRWPLNLTVAGGLLLVPPLLSIRLEQRWLYASFIFLLLTLAWASATLVTSFRWGIVLLVPCAASVAIDSVIEPYFENIFFVSSARFAAEAKKSIADARPGDTHDLALVAPEEHCDWSLLEGRFFAVYGGSQRKVHCFASLDEASAASLPPATPIYKLTVAPP
jgi:hypothetical protein